MPVVKKRNEQTETRLLLESSEPVELPPAEIADRDVLVQFDQFKPFVPELLEELRDGTTAQPVAVNGWPSTAARPAQTQFVSRPMLIRWCFTWGGTTRSRLPVNC